MQPGEAFHITTVVMAGRQGYPMHTHADFAELFLVESGHGSHLLRNGAEPLHSGDLVLIRPRDAHGFKAISNRTCRYINLAFPIGSLNALQKRYYPAQKNFWGGESAVPAKYSLDTDVKETLLEALQDLSRRERIRVHVERFLLVMLDALDKVNSSAKPGPEPNWLYRAIRDIRKPESLTEGLPAFLRLAGRSPEHVARETRRWTGQTPTDLVNQARLDHAAYLLNMSNKDIVDIALECGFQNLSHFYRLFKKQFGQSPRAHRIQLQRIFSARPGQSITDAG